MLYMMLRLTLRTTPCMMLRMMLCVTVPPAHDAAQPPSPNLSCPFFLSTSLVQICLAVQEGWRCFRCRSVLGIRLLRLQVAVFELEMRERPFRTFPRLKIEVAMFELDLRERASHATFARKHLRSWSCCGNAFRVQLWPEPWERTSRTTFAPEKLRFCSRSSQKALHVLSYLNIVRFQPKLRERTSRTTFVLTICDFAAAPLEMLFTYFNCIKKPELRECTSRTTFCTYNLRFRSRASGHALHVLLWYFKLANFQPERTSNLRFRSRRKF